LYMRPEDRHAGALWDMRFYAREAVKLTDGYSFETWSNDDLAIYAIERVVQNIGEAAMRLTRDFQAQHPEIDWRGMINLRHVLVHRYEEVNLQRVWNVATARAPELIVLVDALGIVEPSETPDDLTP